MIKDLLRTGRRLILQLGKKTAVASKPCDPMKLLAVFLHTLLCNTALLKANGQEYVKYEKQVSGTWSQWSKWSHCTSSTFCLGGTRNRHRKCIKQEFKSVNCLGEYAELEECPKKNCRKIQPMIYTDVAKASMSSFISQECNTDAKYSVASKHGKRIPNSILQRFQQKLMHFLHGFFNILKLEGRPDVSLKNITKVCFEPKNLLYKDLPSIFRFNRKVKASLLNGDRHVMPDDVIYGLAVATEDDSGLFNGIYYAIKSKHYGYRTVGYRRWRGQGVLDAL